MRSCACARLGTRGATSLEFALVGILLMTLVFAGVELGRFMMSLHALRTTVADAARAVALQGAGNLNAARDPCVGLSGPLTGFSGRAVILGNAAVTVTMDGCSTLGAVTTVTLTATLSFTFVIPVFGGVGPSLQEVAQTAFH